MALYSLARSSGRCGLVKRLKSVATRNWVFERSEPDRMGGILRGPKGVEDSVRGHGYP